MSSRMVSLNQLSRYHFITVSDLEIILKDERSFNIWPDNIKKYMSHDAHRRIKDFFSKQPTAKAIGTIARLCKITRQEVIDISLKLGVEGPQGIGIIVPYITFIKIASHCIERGILSDNIASLVELSNKFSMSIEDTKRILDSNYVDKVMNHVDPYFRFYDKRSSFRVMKNEKSQFGVKYIEPKNLSLSSLYSEFEITISKLNDIASKVFNGARWDFNRSMSKINFHKLRHSLLNKGIKLRNLNKKGRK